MKIDFKSCGKNLSGILEQGSKEKPAIILCHGLSSNKDRPHYEEMAEELNRNSIASLRFDFYGHGESEGEFEDFNFEIGKQNMLDAINYLKEQGYTKFILSGSSFMGVCAIMAAENNQDIMGLTLLSPGSGSRPYDFVYKLAERIEQPVYIIHGDKDDCVPIENSKKLAKTLKHVELDIIPNADHTFTNKKELRKNKVMDFIQRMIL